ncbi:MAG: hemolysin D [Planctomycetaceae bacterium]|nr:MAG: hemolysin D [Planctomycetaceae bacterium]
MCAQPPLEIIRFSCPYPAANLPTVLLIVRIALLGLAACHAGCGGVLPQALPHSGPATGAEEPPPQRVEVYQVRPVSWPITLRVQGALVADETSVIGAKVAGRVADVFVDVGDVIEPGACLVRLDDHESQLELTHAEALLAQACAAIGVTPEVDLQKIDKAQAPIVRQEASLVQEARAQYERAVQLEERQAITTAELEQLRAALEVAESRHASALNAVEEKIAVIGVRRAEVALARQRLAETTIRAPYAGVVAARHIAVGDYVQVGQPVLTLVRIHPLRFRGVAPERYALQIQPGLQVSIRWEGGADSITSQIHRVSPVLDENSRTVSFEAYVENAQRHLRSGLFAEAEIILEPEHQALTIPAKALTEFAGVRKVWRVVEERVEECIVQTGAQRGRWVEITAGLQEGDVIVTAGEGLRAGRRVVLVPDEESAEQQPPNKPMP